MAIGKENSKIEITVVFVPTSRSANISALKEESLQEVINSGYEKLEEPKKAGDQYFCKTGNSLMSDLTKKIEDVYESTCKIGVIEIRRNTGGAKLQ